MAATGLLGMNPYRKGVVLDISSKPTALYVDMQQKERARQDALDKYFMEYDKNINPAGMRTQDINGLLGKQMENKSFYYQNKKAIQNPAIDGGRAYTQWMNSNKEMLAKVSESKQAAANGLIVKKANIDAKKNGMVTDDETMSRLMLSEKSIWDKDYQPFDVASFSAYKPFDLIEFQKKLYGDKQDRFTLTTVKSEGEGDRIKDISITAIDPAKIPQLEGEIKVLVENSFRAKDGTARYIMKTMQDENEMKKINNTLQKYINRNATDVNDIALGIALQYAPSKIETKFKGFTKEAQITMAIMKKFQSEGGRVDDAKVTEAISDIYMASPTVTNDIVTAIKPFMPTIIGLRNVTNAIPEKAKERFKDMDYVLQDSNFNLYAFDLYGNRISNIEGKTNEISVIPARTYAIDFSTAILGQKETKRNINITPKAPQTQPSTSNKTIKFTDNGRVYNIPESAVNEFLKDHPKAKKS